MDYNNFGTFVYIHHNMLRYGLTHTFCLRTTIVSCLVYYLESRLLLSGHEWTLDILSFFSKTVWNKVN